MKYELDHRRNCLKLVSETDQDKEMLENMQEELNLFYGRKEYLLRYLGSLKNIGSRKGLDSLTFTVSTD